MSISDLIMKSAILLLACAWLVTAYPPPHPDVVALRHEEESLPLHLRKTALHKLHNPNLQDILPLSSLLHKGETLVFQREAHAVSRKEIYNILTHAGFVPRRHPLLRHDLHRPAAPETLHESDIDIFDIPLLQSQDLLQYL